MRLRNLDRMKSWMGAREYVEAIRPTLYFVGVTTGNSSIMKSFPEWAEILGLKDVVIKGIDFKLHDEPQAYARPDVYDRESSDKGPLHIHNRVTATPHIGGYTTESVSRATFVAVENLLRYFEKNDVWKRILESSVKQDWFQL